MQRGYIHHFNLYNVPYIRMNVFSKLIGASAPEISKSDSFYSARVLYNIQYSVCFVLFLWNKLLTRVEDLNLGNEPCAFFRWWKSRSSWAVSFPVQRSTRTSLQTSASLLGLPCRYDWSIVSRSALIPGIGLLSPYLLLATGTLYYVLVPYGTYIIVLGYNDFDIFCDSEESVPTLWWIQIEFYDTFTKAVFR
jgi:hypothetical protein